MLKKNDLGRWRDPAGSVALVYALFATVLAMLIGVSLDIAQALGSKTKLQAALDAAVLSACNRTEQDEASQTLKSTFAANMPAHARSEARLTNFTNAGGRVKVKAAASIQMPMVVLSLLGFNSLPVAAEAAASTTAVADQITITSASVSGKWTKTLELKGTPVAGGDEVSLMKLAYAYDDATGESTLTQDPEGSISLYGFRDVRMVMTVPEAEAEGKPTVVSSTEPEIQRRLFVNGKAISGAVSSFDFLSFVPCGGWSSHSWEDGSTPVAPDGTTLEEDATIRYSISGDCTGSPGRRPNLLR